MEIKKLDDVTKESVLALRKSLGLTQTKFWGAIGVSQVMGSKYENGNADLNSSTHIRKEIIMLYVCNIDTTCDTEADIERLKALGKADTLAKSKKQKITRAIEAANQVIDNLTTI